MLRHRRRVPLGDPQVRTDEPPGRTLEALLLASGQGDAAAFTSLYDRVAPRLYGLVHRILGDDRRAEDVTVQVFVELWETSIGFDPRHGSARAWITSIAHRRAVEGLRLTGRRATGREAAAPQLLAKDGAGCAGEGRALELAYLDGHTHHEVSRLLGLSPGTAASRIRRELARVDADRSPVAREPA